MTFTSFPTTLSEVTFRDDSISSSLYHSIRDIRRSTLSLPNRFKSIVADHEYVRGIADIYRLPLIANERCGSWYVDPTIKVGSAYFKSTDGHHGQWKFSLRRLNLPVLSIVGQHGGAILVDSTRRGKSIPDAFSKTVPIWAAVMNRALFPEQSYFHPLQTPPSPTDLGQSEVSQIEQKIFGFLTTFQELDLNMDQLRSVAGKPIALEWVANGLDILESPKTRKHGDQHDCHRLILCSASRRVRGAETSEGGYVQGAGDDSEAWGHGLTPQLFWQHRRQLMECTAEEDLPETIARLAEDLNVHPSPSRPIRIHPTTTLSIGPFSTSVVGKFDIVIDCSAKFEGVNNGLIGLGCRGGKLGSRDLREKLQTVVDFVQPTLKRKGPIQILICCSTCKDLSAGVALALICLFYSDGGEQSGFQKSSSLNKTFIKKRLAWISSSLPDVNPSRATLQSVNAFLMDRP